MSDATSKKTSFDLRSIESSDRNNFETSLRLLGHAAALPDDLDDTYGLLNDALRTCSASISAPQSYAAALFAACRVHLQLGFVSLMRLHSRVSFQETRTALEAAGIACEIVHNEKSFAIFAADDGSEARRHEVRNWFKTNLIFSSRDKRLSSMKDQFNFAAQLSHTNALTLKRHFEMGPSAVFSCQDISQSAVGSELPAQFFWMCQAHIAILCSADLAFASVPRLDEFLNQRQYVFQKVQRFDQKRRGQTFGS